jgi:hypothetical protein
LLQESAMHRPESCSRLTALLAGLSLPLLAAAATATDEPPCVPLYTRGVM